jgi:hypothetical protein
LALIAIAGTLVVLGLATVSRIPRRNDSKTTASALLEYAVRKPTRKVFPGCASAARGAARRPRVPRKARRSITR